MFCSYGRNITQVVIGEFWPLRSILKTVKTSHWAPDTATNLSTSSGQFLLIE